MSPVCYPFFQPHANFSFSPLHLDLPLFIPVGTDRIKVVHLYRLIENSSPTGYALGIFLSVTFHREDGVRLSASHVRTKPHHTKKAQERRVRAPYFSGNKSGIKVACFGMDNWGPFNLRYQFKQHLTPSSLIFKWRYGYLYLITRIQKVGI